MTSVCMGCDDPTLEVLGLQDWQCYNGGGAGRTFCAGGLESKSGQRPDMAQSGAISAQEVFDAGEHVRAAP